MRYYLEIATTASGSSGSNLYYQVRERTTDKAAAIASIEDYREDLSGYAWKAQVHYCTHADTISAPCSAELLEENSGASVPDTEKFLDVQETSYDPFTDVPMRVLLKVSDVGNAVSMYNSKYKKKFTDLSKPHTKKYKEFVNKKKVHEEDLP